MTTDRKLIVSFHDLHPGSRAQCERFLELCRSIGVTRTTLLVVPRWHGAPACDEDREFAAWLRARVEEGHEACLHAYVHEATEVTGNAVQRAMGKHYTAGEGEFYQIGRDEAERRLREGLRIVRDGCGVPVWGFTAPAWLLSDPAREALCALGFHYTTRWGNVELLHGGVTVDAPVLVWSVRAAWRRLCSRGWVRLWGAWNRRAPVLRVAVHPVDFAHPAIETSVRATIARHLCDRTAACYRDLLPAGTPALGGAK
ncbi:MAG TPA: polysaccharide deacetylase family protein [Opitutaceae bacterium]|nr:polysaccharide deacetylase family protein [Opitutaceae bacterium]